MYVSLIRIMGMLHMQSQMPSTKLFVWEIFAKHGWSVFQISHDYFGQTFVDLAVYVSGQICLS